MLCLWMKNGHLDGKFFKKFNLDSYFLKKETVKVTWSNSHRHKKMETYKISFQWQMNEWVLLIWV